MGLQSSKFHSLLIRALIGKIYDLPSNQFELLHVPLKSVSVWTTVFGEEKIQSD